VRTYKIERDYTLHTEYTLDEDELEEALGCKLAELNDKDAERKVVTHSNLSQGIFNSDDIKIVATVDKVLTVITVLNPLDPIKEFEETLERMQEAKKQEAKAARKAKKKAKQKADRDELEERIFRPQVQCYCPRDPEGHLWNPDEGCPFELVSQPAEEEE
jgi:hypothetical protein